MTRRLELGIGLLAIVAVGFLFLRRVRPRLADPEVSNVGDFTDARLEQPPETFVSAKSLLVPSAHKVRDRIVDDATDAGFAGAPYFIQFGDGRYVFGHTDAQGYTG